MEKPSKALSPRVETDWMNDPSIGLRDHIDRVANFDYATMDPDVVSRHQAHEANIQQKEIRRDSIKNNRKAVMAHRVLINTVEV